MSVDKKLSKERTLESQKGEMMDRLTGRDGVALERKYHKICMTNYSNRHRAFLRQSSTNGFEILSKNETDARVFVELIDYIKCELQTEKYLFHLSNLYTVFTDRLRELGLDKSKHITRLKMQIANHFEGKIREQP